MNGTGTAAIPSVVTAASGIASVFLPLWLVRNLGDLCQVQLFHFGRDGLQLIGGVLVCVNHKLGMFENFWAKIYLLIASVDVDKIAKEVDFQALQANIINITFCNINSEVYVYQEYREPGFEANYALDNTVHILLHSIHITLRSSIMWTPISSSCFVWHSWW